MGNTFVDKQRRELGRQRKTEKEMQSKLIQKEKEICDLETKMKSILMVTESIVIKTEMELFKFSKIHNEKLNEKENEISDLKMAQKELLELNLIEKENEIRDICENQKELLDLELIKKENEICDFKKTQNELESKFRRKLIENEQQICDFKKSEKKLESRLFTNNNEIHYLSTKIQSYKQLNNEQMNTNQEKIKLEPNQICKTKWIAKTEIENSLLYKTQNAILIEKEKKILDIHETLNKLEAKLIEKEKTIYDFKKNQSKSELKLIEKDAQIENMSKIQEELKLKLIEKENQIHKKFQLCNQRNQEKIKFADRSKTWVKKQNIHKN